MRLMRNIRESIINKSFPEFVKKFMLKNYPDKNYPQWIIDALNAVKINLFEKEEALNNEALNN